jgi:competence protein ComEC
MRSEVIFLFGLVSLCLGIISGIILSLPIMIIMGFLISLAFFLFKKEKTILILFLVFILGAWRSDAVFSNLEKNKIQGFCGREVNIIGRIVEDPIILDAYGKAKIKTEYVGKERIKSVILIYFYNPKAFSRFDKIEFKGTLKSSLDYKNDYYKKQGISAIAQSEEIKIIKSSSFSFLTHQKNRMREIIDERLSVPFNTILSAMILGDNYGLTQDLKDSLNSSGLRHIISISGTHITIIMNLLMVFFLFLNISRRKSGILTLFTIFLYIIFIGFYAPAIRAAVMGASLILAQIFSRLPDPFRFLLFAGAIILFLNPFLFFDAGFWLSFTATVGMIFFSNYFTKKIKKVLKNKTINQILGMTFAAQIFSFPILLYYFGTSPILAFISNILVEPVIPLIISFGFIALLSSFIIYPLGIIFFVIIQFLISYLIFISNLMEKILPLSFNFFPNIFIVLSAYILLIIWARKIKRDERLEFLEY